MEKKYFYLLTVSCLLAFVVITLGAYVRLSDAGLGCPDWPGCYGKLIAPSEQSQIHQANEIYPERPVETEKAWKEMIHRYAAGILLILVAVITIKSWRDSEPKIISPILTSSLMLLILFQALLGMWTVTLLLKPVVVMAHLLGGMTVLLLLSLLLHQVLNYDKYPAAKPDKSTRCFVLFGLLIVYVQIALGGWTSANYAALVCSDLPTCQGAWWPNMDFKQGFTFWTGLGKNYEFGLLPVEARTAIHFIHRVGAVITFLYISILSVCLFLRYSGPLRWFSLSTLLLLCLQLSLGIMNILFVLPIGVAVAHNGVAALLLISVGSLLYHSLRNNRL